MRRLTRLTTSIVVAGFVMAPFAPAAFAAEDDHLIAQYNFDHPSDRGADSSGNGHTMDTSAGSPAFGTPTGRDSTALELSGDAGQYARIPDDVFAAAGEDFTLEFSTESESSGNGFFTVGIGKDDHRYLLIKLDQDGGGRVAIATDQWRNEQGFTFRTSPGWHTYRLVAEPGVLAMFVDGELVGSKTDVTISAADLQGSTAYLGRSFYSGDRYYYGAFDDVSVWDDVELPVPVASLAITGDQVVDGSVAIAPGRSTKLAATARPAAAPNLVRWTSSDPSIASVGSDGAVAATALGTATITATSIFDGSIAASTTVRVVDGGEAALHEDLRTAVAAVSTTTTENLPLFAKGAQFGSDITWSTSDASVVTGTGAAVDPGAGIRDPYQGAGIIHRAAYGDGDRTATLTATATLNGATVTSAPIQVTVKENTRSAPDTAYAAVNMRNENTLFAQSVWLSSTDGPDFFSFETRNGGEPAIQGDSDTHGLRDHYVQKSHGGDKYYLMATDLDSVTGDWGAFGSRGSLKLEVYESADLVHWSRTNGDGNGGITVNAPTSGMTWAPESYWDDTLQSYVVFFSSNEYTEDSRNTPVAGANGGLYTQVFAVLTRDFKTFTYPPFHWENTGYGRIDSHVFQIGDYYYRLTKNEEGGAGGPYLPGGKMTFLERSKVLTSTTTETSPYNDPNLTWQLLDESLLPFEGPASVKLLPDDPNNNAAKDGMVILSDGPDEQYGGEQRYLPFMTSESQIEATNWNNRLSQTPGWMTIKQPGPGVTGRVDSTGMPAITRHGAFFTIPESISTALKDWSSVEAVDSITTATFDETSRVVRAQVTAADEGTVAGNVTFSATSDAARATWSERVKLAEDGSAEVTIPADLAGTVSVAYDGYDDGLVTASSTSVMGIEAAAGTDPSPSSTSSPTPGLNGAPASSGSASRLAATGQDADALVIGTIVAAGVVVVGLALMLTRRRRGGTA